MTAHGPLRILTAPSCWWTRPNSADSPLGGRWRTTHAASGMAGQRSNHPRDEHGWRCWPTSIYRPSGCDMRARSLVQPCCSPCSPSSPRSPCTASNRFRPYLKHNGEAPFDRGRRGEPSRVAHPRQAAAHVASSQPIKVGCSPATTEAGGTILKIEPVVGRDDPIQSAITAHRDPSRWPRSRSGRMSDPRGNRVTAMPPPRRVGSQPARRGEHDGP